MFANKIIPSANTPQNSLEHISAMMRLFAFKNPFLTIEEVEKGILSGHYTSFLSVGNTILIRVILSVSPTDDEQHFWHCSVSFINKANGYPRQCLLLTKNQRIPLRNIAERFLGNVGEIEMQKFAQFRYGYHLYRDLTAKEKVNVVCLCGHPKSDHFNAGERNICGGGSPVELHEDISCLCEGFETALEVKNDVEN